MLTNKSINFIKQDEVLLNSIIIAQGAVSASLTKHIEYDELDKPNQIVEINGVLLNDTPFSPYRITKTVHCNGLLQ